MEAVDPRFQVNGGKLSLQVVAVESGLLMLLCFLARWTLRCPIVILYEEVPADQSVALQALHWIQRDSLAFRALYFVYLRRSHQFNPRLAHALVL